MPEVVRWLLIGATLGFGLYAVRQLVRGMSTGRAGSGDLLWPAVFRASQPLMFWLYIFGWVGGAISGLGLASLLLFAPTIFLDAMA